MARVLGRDEIRRAQQLNGAVGDVAEVADGRCTEIEASVFVHCCSSVFVIPTLFYTGRTPCCQGKPKEIIMSLKFRLYFTFFAFNFSCIHI
jgi:hypothetical protein